MGMINAICIENDRRIPAASRISCATAKSDQPPVYEVAETPFIKDKIREGVLVEVATSTASLGTIPKTLALQRPRSRMAGCISAAQVQQAVADARAQQASASPKTAPKPTGDPAQSAT